MLVLVLVLVLGGFEHEHEHEHEHGGHSVLRSGNQNRPEIARRYPRASGS